MRPTTRSEDTLSGLTIGASSTNSALIRYSPEGLDGAAVFSCIAESALADVVVGEEEGACILPSKEIGPSSLGLSGLILLPKRSLLPNILRASSITHGGTTSTMGPISEDLGVRPQVSMSGDGEAESET